MKLVKYKETQSMYWFVVLFILISILIIVASYFKWGNNPIPSWDITILLVAVILFPVALVYNLKITISTQVAAVRFGIGWIKREIPIQDLDLTTAEIVNIPWYSGVGYRISNKGTFFNTKPGPALLIKTKNRNTSFFVGTKHGKEIIAMIEEIQKQENLKV